MSYITFHAPPLPYYISGGYGNFSPSYSHPARRNIGVFDLLVVRTGCLFLGEEERNYEVRAGQALLLLPDLSHFATQPCEEETSFFWLHFQIPGPWCHEERERASLINMQAREEPPHAYYGVATDAEPFSIRLAQFSRLETPSTFYALLESLIELDKQPQAGMRWKQHLLFQSVLQELGRAEWGSTDPVRQIAEQTAAFLRAHYQEEISYALLQEELHFHPTHLSRCMRKIFGVTPLEYLINWRIEQARQLLLNTSLPVSQVASQVGFHHLSYFIRCFTRREGITPQVFRKQFHL